LLIIDKGKKMVEGSVGELFDPAETLVQLETIDNTKTLQQLQHSEWSSMIQPGIGSTIVVRMNRDAIPAFHKSVVQMGIGVLSLQPRHSLEDYFLQVTTGNQHVGAFAN
jgi:hypothetical protein